MIISNAIIALMILSVFLVFNHPGNGDLNIEQSQASTNLMMIFVVYIIICWARIGFLKPKKLILKRNGNIFRKSIKKKEIVDEINISNLFMLLDEIKSKNNRIDCLNKWFKRISSRVRSKYYNGKKFANIFDYLISVAENNIILVDVENINFIRRFSELVIEQNYNDIDEYKAYVLLEKLAEKSMLSNLNYRCMQILELIDKPSSYYKIYKGAVSNSNSDLQYSIFRRLFESLLDLEAVENNEESAYFLAAYSYLWIKGGATRKYANEIIGVYRTMIRGSFKNAVIFAIKFFDEIQEFEVVDNLNELKRSIR